MKSVVAGFFIAAGIGCSSTPKEVTPTEKPPIRMATYMLGSGQFEVSGTFKTAEVELPWNLKIERTCESRDGAQACASKFHRTVKDQSYWYETRTIERPTGVHEIYFKNAEIEQEHDSMTLPAIGRLPHRWTKGSVDGADSECVATRDADSCPDGIRVHCESTQDATLTVDVRVLCPDAGQTLHRRVGSYSALCEQLLDVSYDRWRGADTAELSARLRARPAGCERTTPIGWTHQTPNRAWSVALPERGRMVLGPNKWTVNLHHGEMSFIAYEGTGPNASVKSDADIAGMRKQFEETVAPLLGATAGEPVKRGDSSTVDWLIPLSSSEGRFAGAVRLIARDGRMFSLTTTGPDEKAATEFLESFTVRDERFAAEAVGAFDTYLEDGREYRSKVCACKDMKCAREVPDLDVPTRGFPSTEQEQKLAALGVEINECAARLGNQPP